MYISLYGRDTEPLSPSRLSAKYLQLTEIGETLGELRDADFLRPDGTSDYTVKYLEKGERDYDFGLGWELVSAGTVLLYRPGEIQSARLRKPDDSNEFVVRFSGTAVPAIWTSLGFDNRQRLMIGAATDVVTLFREIIAEIVGNRLGAEQMVNAKLLLLLSLISRRAGCPGTTFAPESSSVIGSMWDKALEPSLQRIHERCREKITVDSLAQACHMSKYYFAHRFREVIGMTPHTYVTKVRISKACRLLTETNEFIEDIAAEVGMPVYQSFCTAFRKEIGCSPLGYRRERAKKRDRPLKEPNSELTFSDLLSYAQHIGETGALLPLTDLHEKFGQLHLNEENIKKAFVQLLLLVSAGSTIVSVAGIMKSDKPITGGNTVFGQSEFMYPGEPTAAAVWSNAFANADWTGCRWTAETVNGVKAVRVVHVRDVINAYMDFNYYQWDNDNFYPSLDSSRYRFFKVVYMFNEAAARTAGKSVFWAAEDAPELGKKTIGGELYFQQSSPKANEWITDIVDLSDLQLVVDGKLTLWKDVTIRQFRYYPFGYVSGRKISGDAVVWVEYMAFFETREEAEAYKGPNVPALREAR